MSQTFGNFVSAFPPDRDSLELSFTPTSERIKHRWRNQRLSAHFLAEYFANFLPLDQDNPDDEQRIKETKSSISYIANELLENAMKFNLEAAQTKVKFGIHFLEKQDIIAVMFATNSVDQVGAEKFKTFIETLLASDPEEFYIQQVEASAENEDANISGLGFLTMINDYNAQLGWQMLPAQSNPGVITVTTMAQVAV